MRMFLLFIIFFIASFLFVWWWHGESVRTEAVGSSFGFDAQNAGVWRWTARRRLLPYRDVFYPYGLLPYFQENNPVVFFIQLTVSSLTMAIVLFSLRRELKGMFSLVALIAFLLFILRYVGFETWSRYGVGIAACFVLPFVVDKTRHLYQITFGIITGLLFGLLFDQALYMGVLYIVFISFAWFLERGRSLHSLVQRACMPIVLFGFGFIVGNVPFLFYLISTKSVSGFLFFLSYLPEVSRFAKTPFLPYALSPANMFSFAVLFTALSTLSFAIIVKSQRRLSLSTLLLFLLTAFTVLLEQKSIVRSIDWQITLPTFLMLLILMGKFLSWIKEKGIWRSLYYFGSTILLAYLIFVYPFRYVHGQQLVIRGDADLYERVISVIKLDPFFNGKLFSYPSDPYFYTLTGQKPPYFFTSYETTPRDAQSYISTYLKDKDIRFVVYNLNIPAVQDGVPNFARNGYELAYIFSHYEAWKTVDHFLIFKKKGTVDVGKICMVAPNSHVCGWEGEIRHIVILDNQQP